MTRARTIADYGNGITADEVDLGQIGGRRNLIINGAYTIWQRATTSSSNGVNTADRWQQNDATFTQETSIVPDNFQYSMKVVANGSGTPLLLQKMERPQVCGHIVNQDITVSFYARSSNVNAITKLELNDEGGSGGRPDGGAQTLSAADTWERITHTFTAPFSSLTGNSVAVILTFATSATVYISGFQVEVGSVATPFEHRSFGEELAACQRYYTKSYDYSIAPGTAGQTNGGIHEPEARNRTGRTLGCRFPQAMRSQPTVKIYSPGGTVDKVDNNGDKTASAISIGINGYAYVDITSGTTSSDVWYQFTAESEL